MLSTCSSSTSWARRRHSAKLPEWTEESDSSAELREDTIFGLGIEGFNNKYVASTQARHYSTYRYFMRRLLALLLIAAFAFSIVSDANAGTKRAKKARSAKSSKSAKKAKSAKPKKFIFFGKKTTRNWNAQSMA